VKAEMRAGSVKVWYSSEAGARNSSASVTVVVFTEVVLALGAADEEEEFAPIWLLWRVRVVGKLAEGLVPGACCISFPCSAIKAGPRPANCLRSWGTILARTRSFTGAFELASE